MKKALLLLPIGFLPFVVSCGGTPPVVTKTYTIKFENWDKQVLKTLEVEEGKYPIYDGETPVHSGAAEQHEYVYAGWDKDIEKATKDITYTATFDYVYLYGYYPQTLVTDDQLITRISAETVGADGYKTVDGKKYYEYTAKQNFRADDGTYVDISKETSAKYKYYEVKPIQWKILTEDKTSHKELFCTTYKLLVTQYYNENDYEEPEQDCKYVGSHLANWLNSNEAPDVKTDLGNFAWRAFGLYDLYDGIYNSPVDNSVTSTGQKDNRFADDTPFSAKVFALSRQNLHGEGDKDFATEKYDFAEGDGISKTKLALTTDLARASGAVTVNNYGIYWTRSPADTPFTSDEDKYVYTTTLDGAIIWFHIEKSTICARPAIRFTLN